MRNRSGFTLAEVIVSLAILGLLLSLAFEALRVSHSTMRIASDAAIAPLLAQNKLEQFRNQKTIKILQHSGRFPAPNDDFQWKAKISEVRHLENIYLIHIEVSGNSQSFSLESYLVAQQKINK